jgi:hypothetical protein
MTPSIWLSAASRLCSAASGGHDGGDPAVGVGQRGCRGDVALELGDQRGGAALPLGEVLAELLDRVLQQHRLADRLFGGADAHRGLAALARTERGLGGGDLLVGERDALAGLRGVVGDRDQGLGRVRRPERAEPLVRGVDGCRGLRALLLHACEGFGRILLEPAQLVEIGRLVVQARVGLFAEPDDLGVPRAGLRFGVGRGVVELLLEGEGPVEVLARDLQRLLELDGGGIPELRTGESQLLIAGLHGVVGLNERRRGAALELLQIDLLDGRRARARRSPHLAPTVADDQHDDDDRDGGDHQDRDEADGEPARTACAPEAAVGGVVQPGGRGIDRAEPVVGRERGLDQLLLDRGQIVLRDRTGGVAREVELAPLGGDGEQVLRRAEAVLLGRGVRPLLRAGGIRELVDVDDPQIQARVGLQLLQPLLRLGLVAAGEDADLVEDEALPEIDRISGGCGTRSARERDRESRRERQSPSRTHRSPPRGRAVQAPKFESIHGRGAGGSTPAPHVGRVVPRWRAPRG